MLVLPTSLSPNNMTRLIDSTLVEILFEVWWKTQCGDELLPSAASLASLLKDSSEDLALVLEEGEETWPVDLLFIIILLSDFGY